MSDQISAAGFKFDFNEIKTRATLVLKNPKGVWASIKSDGESTTDLFKKYFVFMAAIPVVCGLVGMIVFGFPGVGTFVKVNTGASIVHAVFQYALALAAPIVAGAISAIVAPKFGGSSDQSAATKLFVYSATASQLGGALSLIPALGLLAIIPGIYSLYTLYQGISPMIEVAAEKKIIYIVVMIVAMIVVFGLLNVVVMGMLPPAVSSNFTPGSFGIPG